LEHGDVDIARGVEAIAPDSLAIAVERHRKTGRNGDVVVIDVQLDLDAVREVLARLVEHDMPAGHQEQSLGALEEKAAGIGQVPILIEGRDAGGGEQNVFDHGGEPSCESGAPASASAVSPMRLRFENSTDNPPRRAFPRIAISHPDSSR